MAQQIQLRRDTAENWSIINPVLAEGEAGVELDTLKIKIGDGVSEWNDLNYIPGSADGDMSKATYDSNGNGVVDDSEKLNGQAATHYATASALADKVDKVTGKNLSTEDYTTAEKSKLDGIATNANNYTHPANHEPSIITQDTNNRFVSDAEKTTWNAKSDLALGELSTNAYRGDRGKTAYDHTALTNNPHSVDKTQAGLGNVTNDAQVKKRASSTGGNIPSWNGANGDALTDGYSVESTLTGGSSALARADAIKSYIDLLLGANDAMVYKGAIDCSGNPNYSAGSAGWTWKVSVAGKIGGVSGPNVEVGDMIICTIDDTASGDHATVGANFNIIQVNIDGAVIGPVSSTNDRLAAFDGVSGKLVKDSGYSPSSFTASSHVGATGDAHGVSTTEVNGFMSSTDKSKLDGVASNANNYTHPANHEPSIITQDTNNRFVTDAEKTTWNAKSDLALGELSTNAYRGDRGKTAYDHSQVAHAPSDAQKNSDITKGEIEAKLTGTISTHDHTGLAPGAHASTHITGGSDVVANATTEASGLMSGADKTKLNGVAENANNYTHPANHEPSIITQDTNNRFVSDAEKTTWNAKSNLALGETDSTAYRGDRGKTAYDHTALTNNPHSVDKTQAGLANVTNDAQVKKLAESTSGKVPTWNGTTGDALNDGYSVETTLTGGSTALARADAIKTYVDGLIGANDAMVYKGAIDCSANPNYSAGDAGHTWKISIAGKIGGASGPNVEAGDMVICTVDATTSGTHAAVGANFNIIQVNIDGAVIGPVSSVTNRLAAFDGVSGKLIKDSGYLASDFAASSHVGATGTAHGVSTTEVNGFMSSTDKSKLDGVASNANNYTHPANHEPSIITQDTNNRFVTDAEKTTWNNKSNLALGETDSTAYRGDRGKTAYDHAALTNNPHSVDKTQVGLSSVTNDKQATETNFNTHTGNETDAHGIDRVLAEEYLNDTTVTQSVISLPSTDIETSELKLSAKGNTVTNVLTDAVAGCEATTGWNTSAGTLVTDSDNKYEGTNCLKLTTDATGYGITSRSMLGTINPSKYYLVSGYIKNVDANNAFIRIQKSGGITRDSTIVTAATWIRVGLLLDPTWLDEESVTLDLYFINIGASGKISYSDALMVQEITSTEYALGATALLSKYAWHLGTAHTTPQTITSVGKNLVLSSNMDTDSNSDGVVNDFGASIAVNVTAIHEVEDSSQKIDLTENLNATPASAGVYQSILVDAGDVISVSVQTKLLKTTGTGAYSRLVARFYDTVDTSGNNLATHDVNLTAESVNFTTIKIENITAPATTRSVWLLLTNISTNQTNLATVWFKNAQVEVGSTATTYEAYKETEVTTPVTLRSVSAIADSYDIQSGVHVQKIGIDEDVSGTQFVTLDTSKTNIDAVLTSAFTLAKTGTTAIDGIVRVFNKNGVELQEISFTGYDDAGNVGKFYYGTDNQVRFIIAKGAYADLPTARTDLGQCEVYYQLATPVITEYSPQILQAQKSGTVYLNGEGTIPTVTYSYGENVKAQIDDNSEMIVRSDNIAKHHLNNMVNPHKYEDEGVDPDYEDVQYRFVVKDGEFFLEVVSV